VRVPTVNLNNSANVRVQQHGSEDASLMAATRPLTARVLGIQIIAKA
jgi:hypothetical protein